MSHHTGSSLRSLSGRGGRREGQWENDQASQSFMGHRGELSTTHRSSASAPSLARYDPNLPRSARLQHGTKDFHPHESGALLYDLIKNLGMENSAFDHLMGTFRFECSKLIPFFSGFLEILGMDEGLDLPMLAQQGYIGAFLNMMISCLVLGIKKFPSEGVPNLQLDSLDSETFVDFMENFMNSLPDPDHSITVYLDHPDTFIFQDWQSMGLNSLEGLRKAMPRVLIQAYGNPNHLVLMSAGLYLNCHRFQTEPLLQDVIPWVSYYQAQHLFLQLSLLCYRISDSSSSPLEPMALLNNVYGEVRSQFSTRKVSQNEIISILDQAINVLKKQQHRERRSFSSSSLELIPGVARDETDAIEKDWDEGFGNGELDNEVESDRRSNDDAGGAWLFRKVANACSTFANNIGMGFPSSSAKKRNFSDFSDRSKGSTSSPTESPILSSNIPDLQKTFDISAGARAFKSISQSGASRDARADKSRLSGVKSVKNKNKRLRKFSPTSQRHTHLTPSQRQSQQLQIQSASVPASATTSKAFLPQVRRTGEADTSAIGSGLGGSRVTQAQAQDSAGSGEVERNERERSGGDRSRGRSEDSRDEVGRNATVSVRGDQSLLEDRRERIEEEVEEVLQNVESDLKKKVDDLLKEVSDPKEFEEKYKTIMAPFESFRGSSRAPSTRRAPTPSTSSIGTQTGDYGSLTFQATKNDSSILQPKNVRGISVEQGSTVLSRSSTPTITQERSTRSASPNVIPAISTRLESGRAASEPLSSVVTDPRAASSSQAPSSLPVANLVEGDGRRSDRAGSEPIFTPSVSPEVRSPANTGENFNGFRNDRDEPDEEDQSGSEREVSVSRDDGAVAALREGEGNVGVENDDREREDGNGGAREKENADEVSGSINKAAATQVEDEGDVEGNGDGAARDKGKGPSSNVDTELSKTGQNQPERLSKSTSPGIVLGEQTPADDPPSGSNRPHVETQENDQDDGPAKNRNENADLQDGGAKQSAENSSSNQTVPSQQPPPPRVGVESSKADGKTNDVSSINAQAQAAAQDAPQPARENQDGGSKSPEAKQVDAQELPGANKGKIRASSAPPSSASGMNNLRELLQSRGVPIDPFIKANLNQEGSRLKKAHGSFFASPKALIQLLSHRMKIDHPGRYFLIRAPNPAHGDLSVDSSASGASDADADGDHRMGDLGPEVEEGQAGGVEIDGHRAEVGMGGDEVMLEGADPLNEVMESLAALFLAPKKV